MVALIIILAAAILLVGTGVFFGPPYLPTTRRNIDTALDMLDLKPGQTMLDLGSGDGRVLAAAARRDINAVGIELSPVLYAVSWLRTLPYRKRVRVIWGNYFLVKWPPADAIFTFMIPRQMGKLDKHIERWRGQKPVRLASFAFQVPGKEPAAMKDAVFVYDYK
jgi:SAM-dependent methyltransferase